MKKIKKIKIIYCPEYTGCFSSIFVNTYKMPPTGVAQLTAYLREKGFIVDQDDLNIKIHHDNYYKKDIIDLSIANNEKRVIEHIEKENDPALERLAKKILKKTNFNNYDMICISASYQDNPSPFLISLLLAKYIKKIYNIPIVMGGTIYYLSYPFFTKLITFGCKQGIIDFFIKGFGEKAFYQLIMCINKKQSLDKIHGLVYYKNGKFIDQDFGEFIFQKPDFNGLPLELYQWKLPGFSHIFFGIKNKKILIIPFRFILGCPYHCIFCINSSNNHLKTLPPKEVVKRLKELCNKYNTKYFFFLSPTINFSKKYINELCDEIINNKLNILWSDCARLKDLDKNTLEKMRKAGCIQLVYGLETASPRLLKYIGKGITLEEASRILKLTNEVGIWTSLEIIAGLPTEKEEDIDATLKFLDEHKDHIDNVYITHLHMVEYSLLKCNPEKYGIKNVRNILEFANPNKISYNTLSQVFSFDEINGLNWEEKKKQITYSFQKVFNAQFSKININIYDQLPFLFLAYKNFKDKKIIKEKYNHFCNNIKILNSECNSISEVIKKRFYRIIYQKDPLKLAI